MSDQKTIRLRQVKTTLNREQEEIFNSFCKKAGQRESVVVRNAILKYMRSALSDRLVESNTIEDIGIQ